jgi:hypothetical protein
MIKSRFAFAVAVGALLAASPLGSFSFPLALGTSVAQAQEVKVSFNVFFDKLAPHGQWVRNTHYRYVWCPTVDRTWAPYTHGHWVYLHSRGWYFASDEPFAWAAYHYGRWFRDADIGWCWVPGTVWAPAWVSWRRSSDYVGWAPLRPEGDGFAVSLNISTHESPHEDWFFIPTHSFLRPQLSAEIVFGAQNQDVFARTEYVGPVTIVNNVVVNNVITVNFIEQQTKEKVPVVKAQAVNDPTAVGAASQGDTIAVFDAKIDPPKKDEAPAKAVDAAQATKATATPAPAAGTAAGAAVDAKAGAQTDANGAAAATDATATGKATAPAGKPAATCLPAEMVNGVCPPDTKNKGKPADASKPADTTTVTPKATDTTAPAATTTKPAAPAAPAAETPKPAATTTKPADQAAPATETAKPAATTTAPAKGKDVAKCLPAEMVGGACPPAGSNKHKDVGKPAANTDNAPAAKTPAAPAENNTAPAATDTQNGAAAGSAKANKAEPTAPAADVPPKGKHEMKCLPNEDLVKGACVPKADAKANGANSDTAPAQ